MFQVKIIHCFFVPGKFQQQLHVIGLYAVFSGIGVHSLQFGNLFFEHLFYFGAPLFGFGFFEIAGNFLFKIIATQFFLNGFDLLI